MTQSWTPLDKKEIKKWKENLDKLTINSLEEIRATVTDYYQYLAQHKIAYGPFALQVVQDVGVGKMPIAFTKNFMEDQGAPLTDTQRRTLMLTLAQQDAVYRDKADGMILPKTILKYHGIAYEKAGLPWEAWIGSFFAGFGSDELWTLGQMPEDQQGPFNAEAFNRFTEAASTPGTTTHREMARLTHLCISEGVCKKAAIENPVQSLGFVMRATFSMASAWSELDHSPLVKIKDQAILRHHTYRCLTAMDHYRQTHPGQLTLTPDWPQEPGDLPKISWSTVLSDPLILAPNLKKTVSWVCYKAKATAQIFGGRYGIDDMNSEIQIEHQISHFKTDLPTFQSLMAPEPPTMVPSEPLARPAVTPGLQDLPSLLTSTFPMFTDRSRSRDLLSRTAPETTPAAQATMLLERNAESMALTTHSATHEPMAITTRTGRFFSTLLTPWTTPPWTFTFLPSSPLSFNTEAPFTLNTRAQFFRSPFELPSTFPRSPAFFAQERAYRQWEEDRVLNRTTPALNRSSFFETPVPIPSELNAALVQQNLSRNLTRGIPVPPPSQPVTIQPDICAGGGDWQVGVKVGFNFG